MKQFLIKVCKIREKNINFSRIIYIYIYLFKSLFDLVLTTNASIV